MYLASGMSPRQVGSVLMSQRAAGAKVDCVLARHSDFRKAGYQVASEVYRDLLLAS